MTRSTGFTVHTRQALQVFGDPTPTVPRGMALLPGAPATLADEIFRSAMIPRPRRRGLRPTWTAVAAAGIIGTVAGVLIAVLSSPVVVG